MNLIAGIAILILLLFGPLVVHIVERNIEAYCLLVGILATTIGGGWDWALVRTALTEPILISVAVVVAGLVFGFMRQRFDHWFARMRSHVSRPVLTGVVIFIIAALSSVITAIVAALVLVEAVGLLRLHTESRIRVTIAGCFAVGLGASLTPIGEPLSTLAAHALDLGFFGLFDLLAPYVVPGMVACVVVAGYFARGQYDHGAGAVHARESVLATLWQAIKVFGFIAGLVLISEAYAPLAQQYLPVISNDALFWLNTVSAALDNATLVALEVHSMEAHRAREAIVALLISGGILIPGNIPNIVSAGAMRIRSTQWARLGIPMGVVLLAAYFAAFKLLH